MNQESIKKFFLKFSYTQKMMAVFFLISATVFSNALGILATHLSLYQSLKTQHSGLPILLHLRALTTNLVGRQLEEQKSALKIFSDPVQQINLAAEERLLLTKLAFEISQIKTLIGKEEDKSTALKAEIAALVRESEVEVGERNNLPLKELYYQQKSIRNQLYEVFFKAIDIFELNLNVDIGTARLIDVLFKILPSFEKKLPEFTALLSNQSEAPWILVDKLSGIMGLQQNFEGYVRRIDIQINGIEKELKNSFHNNNEEFLFPLFEKFDTAAVAIDEMIDEAIKLSQTTALTPKPVFDNNHPSPYAVANQSLASINSFYAALENELEKTISEQKSTILLRLLFGIFILFLGGFLALLLYFTRIMRRPISQIKNAAANLSMGDLSVRIQPDYHDEVSEMAVSFNKLADFLSDIMQNAKLIAETLVGSIKSIYTLSDQLEKNTRLEEKELPLIGAKTTEMAELAKQFNVNLGGVYKSISSNTTLANEGRNSLNEMECLITQMVGSSDTIAEALADLKLKVAKINHVINAIIKVADQINLLSLNTAIRAAKAGEEGKGFSVIAKKISELAEQTAYATLDIEKMVEKIIGTLSNSIGKVEKFTDKTALQQGESSELSKELGHLIDFFQEQFRTFENLNEDIEKQTEMALEIHSSVTTLSDSARLTNRSMHSLYAEIELLYQSAIELLGQLKQFKF